MPEGHLIHFYQRAQTRDLAGRPVAASSPQGRFSTGAARVSGHVLESIEARGKHLLYDFGKLVHVHLGMAGSWFRSAGEANSGVRWRLAGGVATWDLVAPSRCELYTPEQRSALLARLGPDPIRRDADADLAFERLSRSRLPLGAALLDQRIVAGVGNVIRNELLFEFCLDPDEPASRIDRALFDRMWTRLVEVMRTSASKGRIVFTGSPRGRRHVYKQAVCAGCGSQIQQRVVGGRTAYVCPSCQVPR